MNLLVDKVHLLLGQATQFLYVQDKAGLDTPLWKAEPEGTAGPGTFVDTTHSVRMISEPAALLQRLYATTSSAERPLFVQALLINLEIQNARVVARTLIATGNVSAFRETVGADSSLELWRGVNHVGRCESDFLSDGDLSELQQQIVMAKDDWRRRARKKMAEDLHQLRVGKRLADGPRDISTSMDPVAHDVMAVITRIRYLRLAHELKTGQNPALDADRVILVSRIKALGLSKKLVEASDEIERRSAVAKSDMDIKSAMDLLRTFLEEFVEDAAKRIEAHVGRSVPNNPKQSHFAPFREYLEQTAIIGREESELLQKLYNFVSNQGTHKLTSAPEQLASPMRR